MGRFIKHLSNGAKFTVERVTEKEFTRSRCTVPALVYLIPNALEAVNYESRRILLKKIIRIVLHFSASIKSLHFVNLYKLMFKVKLKHLNDYLRR